MAAQEVGIGRPTVIDWSNFSRDERAKWVLRNLIELGGLTKWASQLLSKLMKAKSFTGNITEGHWVFGAIERNCGRCNLLEAGDCTAETLNGIISQHIHPGTHIISDGWRAYSNFDNFNAGTYIQMFCCCLQEELSGSSWWIGLSKFRKREMPVLDTKILPKISGTDLRAQVQPF